MQCVCQYCGKAFYTQRPNAPRPYCSRLCANRATGERREKMEIQGEKDKMLEARAEMQGRYMDIKFNRKPSRYTIEKLKDLGFVYDWRYGSWRSTRNKEAGKALAEMSVEMSKKYDSVNRSTLCWSCQQADKGMVSECAWVREFKPVDGWDAEPTTRKMYGFTRHGKSVYKIEDSFCVFACPLYKPDARGKRSAT